MIHISENGTRKKIEDMDTYHLINTILKLHRLFLEESSWVKNQLLLMHSLSFYVEELKTRRQEHPQQLRDIFNDKPAFRQGLNAMQRDYDLFFNA